MNKQEFREIKAELEYSGISIKTRGKILNLCERQIAKKPVYEGDGYAPDGTFVWDEWLCPNCSTRYEVDYDNYKHCPNCGQRIDRPDK